MAMPVRRPSRSFFSRPASVMASLVTSPIMPSGLLPPAPFCGAISANPMIAAFPLMLMVPLSFCGAGVLACSVRSRPEAGTTRIDHVILARFLISRTDGFCQSENRAAVCRLTSWRALPITFSMPSAHYFLDEIIASLRNVIAPAIPDPYPKAQAYMAAVILEFVARQVDERTDIGEAKEAELDTLYGELARLAGMDRIVGGEPPSEAALCGVTERLY